MTTSEELKLAYFLIEKYKNNTQQLEEDLPEIVAALNKNNKKIVESTVTLIKNNEELDYKVAELFNNVVLFKNKMMRELPQKQDEEEFDVFFKKMNETYLMETRKRYNGNEYATKIYLTVTNEIIENIYC